MAQKSTPAATQARGLAWPSPKTLVTLLITLLLVLGEWSYGVVGGYSKLAAILGVCVGVEIVLSLFLLGRFPMVQSAYITGVSLTILLRPQGGLWWPFLVGAGLSIGSKYVLRYRGRHLWNPSNFGIALLLLLAPNQVAILSHEFGNALATNAVIWGVGLLVASRAKVLHISATYVIAFLALAALRCVVVGTPLLAEIAPLTGPLYQLMVFFMLTDPRTTVGTRRGRMLTVAGIAVLEAIFRLGNDLDWPFFHLLAPAPPIFALALLGPLVLFFDLRARARGATVPASGNAVTARTPDAIAEVTVRSEG